jgi:hypothetical protein
VSFPPLITVTFGWNLTSTAAFSWCDISDKLFKSNLFMLLLPNVPH